MAQLIIKNAIYTNGDCLLRPHFTGEYSRVDCTQYFTKEQIKADYSETFAKEATGKNAIYLTYKGVKYYECEYSPYHTADMELLSDLSDFDFYDYNTEF